jgi:outer membrane protein TolC
MATCTACALLAACASYSPAPLADHPVLPSDIAALTVDPAKMPLPELGTHRFDPTQPLDMDEVAMIAVVNNPDLKATRDQAGVAGAQAFNAGLLPNPQVAVDYGILTGGPGTANSFLFGLTQDIVPLLTRAARKAGASASAESARLDVLWQEWQVVSQARLLFVRAVELAQQRSVAEASRQLFDARYQRSSNAMKIGNETLPTVVSDLSALQGVETQLHDLDQQMLKNRHDLNALLGLAPEARLDLAETASVPPIDAGKLAAILPELARRRPDLLALAFGYEAQEQKVRQAIIEQFPGLSIGTNRASDTTAVHTQGLSISISLPIFNHNQGNIAIERTTRQRLRDEYQARLDTAYGAAARLVTEQTLLEQQYKASRAGIRQLEDAAAVTDRAFATGNLDERSYVDLRAALLAKKLETLKLEQTMLEQRINLQTLIGSDLPARGKLPREAR